MESTVQAVAPYIESFFRYNRFIDSVRATGWLPYHTVSIVQVEECEADTSLLESHLSSFYTEHWEVIRKDIESRLGQYHISEEAKETFREALSAHSLGHYRCVCRVLFPEIEREFRIHFFEDAARSISSRDMLTKLTDRRKLETFMPREAYGLILFGRLVHHLYEPVHIKNRTQFEQDYVPNRHASIHGIIRYSTHKHSMNMIIMADYIFQILTSTADLPSSQK